MGLRLKFYEFLIELFKVFLIVLSCEVYFFKNWLYFFNCVLLMSFVGNKFLLINFLIYIGVNLEC